MLAVIFSRHVIANYTAQKAKEREERVAKLVETLVRKLSIFTESATGVNDVDVTHSWRTICQLEAECVAFHSGSSSIHSDDW